MNRLHRGLLALPLLAFTGWVMAADAATAVAAPPTAAVAAPAAVAPAAPPMASALSGSMSSGIGGQLFQLVLGLLLVVGLIFVLAWLMRRVQRAGPAGNQVIELIGSRALGPRDRLVLVQIGDEQVLLGVSPGSITALHVMNEPVQVPVSQSTTPEFAKRLMEALGNRGANMDSNKGQGSSGQKDNQ